MPFEFDGTAAPVPLLLAFAGAAAGAPSAVPAAGCVTCRVDGVLALVSVLKRTASPLAVKGVDGTLPPVAVLTAPCAVGCRSGVVRPVDVDAE